MKSVLYLLVGLAMACNASRQTGSQPTTTDSGEVGQETYAQTITESDLKEHLYTYASDEFEGRETGQPGQKKAVEYLVAAYKKLGIPAARENGEYFQQVPLEISQLPTGSILVNGKEYPVGQQVLTFSGASGEFDEIIYAGYGIEDSGYSDYEGLDVTDKIVLVKSGEPKDKDGLYTISGTRKASVWSNMSEAVGKRTDLAEKKGARAILYYDPSNFNRFKSRYNYLMNQDDGQMNLKSKSDAQFTSFYIDGDLAKALVPDIESDDAQRRVPVDLELKVQSENQEVRSENVVAVIKGSDKADEYLVISSHLDHIGVSPDGAINNGADDDGSGTVAMLEIAEAFKQAVDAGMGPRRSIVFLHVTGEEKGLLGSRYYADFNPVFPLENTVANLNIDMIGRIDPKREGDRNYIYLIGSDKLSTELHELSEAVNEKYANLALDYKYNDENDPNRFYYRSDHYNFAKNDIPIIFYFNGTHDDYHRPGDTPDKINYDLLRNRTRLIFHTAWEVANRDRRPEVDKVTR